MKALVLVSAATALLLTTGFTCSKNAPEQAAAPAAAPVQAPAAEQAQMAAPASGDTAPAQPAPSAAPATTETK